MPFINTELIDEKEVIAGFRQRFFHSENMTFAYYRVVAGDLLPEHSHPHEQVVNVIEGQFRLSIEGEAETLTPGKVAVIHKDALHSGEAITDCRIIDVFYPVRTDYR